MQIETNGHSDKLGSLKVAIFDFHGVIVEPGERREYKVTDKDITGLGRKGPSEVSRRVPFEKISGNETNAEEEQRLRQIYLEGKYSPRADIIERLIQLAQDHVRITICSSLPPNLENPLRNFLTDLDIWPQLNPDYPVALKADNNYSALAFKSNSVGEILRSVEQYFKFERAFWQRANPDKVLPETYSRYFGIVEDNPNIAIPTSRILTKQNLPHRFYIPIPKEEAEEWINQANWPESTIQNGHGRESIVYDPDLSIMEEDYKKVNK